VDDIGPLARHFLSEARFGDTSLRDSRLEPLILELESDGWRGNVRELALVISHLGTLSPRKQIDELLDALDRCGRSILRERRTLS
jgi:DNA-binding NtrC family response regulator